MIKLSIIVVSFNTAELTAQCVTSILKYKPTFAYEIIVIDNGSDDESVKLLKKFGSKIILIKNKSNLGFAKANNLGIEQSTAEHILLLNSDTIIDSNVIEKLVVFADEHPDAGVVAPKLLNTDGSMQPSIYRLPTLFRAISQYWLKRKAILDKYDYQKGEAKEVEAVVGAAFLITSKAKKLVGLLDGKYFMYFEDLDYCRKVRQAGLKVYYLPSVFLTHIHGASGNSGVSNLAVDSSKKYFGLIYYYLYTFVLWSGQKMQRLGYK